MIAGRTYAAPSVRPATPDQLAAFGVTVDSLPVSRQAGADRFGTAAAISAATYAPGVPVAYVATGLDFPDALAAAAAAGQLGGPVLLVRPGSVPAATAAELARLRPARIVVVGGPSSVSAAVAETLAGYLTGP
jgi:putative cell wall-binding protein